MASGFEFEMSRNFERELSDLLHDTIADVASEYQEMFDRLGSMYKGRPVAVIRSALQREWARLGGSVSDAELTEYASCISAGTRIEMRVGR